MLNNMPYKTSLYAYTILKYALRCQITCTTFLKFENIQKKFCTQTLKEKWLNNNKKNRLLCINSIVINYVNLLSLYVKFS